MRRRGNCTGWLAVFVGTLIFFSLILPQWFWWLVCGILLVAGGLWLIRC